MCWFLSHGVAVERSLSLVSRLDLDSCLGMTIFCHREARMTIFGHREILRLDSCFVRAQRAANARVARGREA